MTAGGRHLAPGFWPLKPEIRVTHRILLDNEIVVPRREGGPPFASVYVGPPTSVLRINQGGSTMHRTFLRLLTVAALAPVFLAPAAAHAGSDVKVALTAQRVSVIDGKETLLPATQAKPGDVLEYRATYKNAGDQPARQVMATLPVPAGMEFVGRTASPSKLEASLDGQTYATVPLTRRVKQADGREVVRVVPTTEYRWLRWPLGTLGSNSTRTVVARMRVQTAPVADATH
jgi:uncharacterized repeat protein (TIGR01451 family)